MVQTVIFDMDGTILNTLEDLCDSVNAAMRHFGWPERTLDEVRRFVGNGAQKLIERAVPEGTSGEEIGTALDWYRAWYEAHSRIRTGPYPGIVDALTELKRRGVKMAVVSNKPDGAVGILARAYFPGLFDAVIGDRPGFAPKPAPDSVRLAMSLLDADPAATVYVGDSEVDVATARNAGLPCVSVTWGFREPEALRRSGAVCLVSTADELLDALTGKEPRAG